MEEKAGQQEAGQQTAGRHNILDEFDPEKEAIINPWDLNSPREGFPECLVLNFTRSIVEKWAAMPESRQIGCTTTANGRIPIYAHRYRGTEIAFSMALVGAATCVGVLEDWIVMGARYIVVYGSCGVLNREIADGHMIIPAIAVRDEGTSYHYAPPSDEIGMDPESVRVLSETMEELGYPYVVGKTWTTDGFARETRAKMERRKAAGCITVEMECSALLAMAQFRGVRLAQFLYAADNLDSDEWERRGLHIDQGLSNSERYMQVAMEACLRLRELDGRKAQEKSCKAEPCKVEPCEAEPSQAEPCQAEASQAEPCQTESSQAEPCQAESSQAELCQAEPSQAEPCQAEASQAEPCQAESSQAEPCQAEPSQAEACHAEACEAEPHQERQCKIKVQLGMKRAGLEEAEVLHELKKRAFLPLLEKYQDFDTSPANEPLEKTIAILKQEHTEYFIFYLPEGEELKLGARPGASSAGGVRLEAGAGSAGGVRLEAGAGSTGGVKPEAGAGSTGGVKPEAGAGSTGRVRLEAGTGSTGGVKPEAGAGSTCGVRLAAGAGSTGGVKPEAGAGSTGRVRLAAGTRPGAGCRVVGAARIGVRPVCNNPVCGKDPDEFNIAPVYVDPDFQNMGIGRQMMQMIFEAFPEAEAWKLDTILQEARNCHFYESMGFARTGEEREVNECLTLVGYKRKNG